MSQRKPKRGRRYDRNKFFEQSATAKTWGSFRDKNNSSALKSSKTLAKEDRKRQLAKEQKEKDAIQNNPDVFWEGNVRHVLISKRNWLVLISRFGLTGDEARMMMDVPQKFPRLRYTYDYEAQKRALIWDGMEDK